MNSGTITTPPPMPKSPEKNPAAVPTSPSFTVRACGMRGILGRVSAAMTLAEALEVVRADPSRSAVLLDVDGTLAPIVRHADDAHVPEVTRTQLIAVSRRYRLVACVSGRRAATAAARRRARDRAVRRRRHHRPRRLPRPARARRRGAPGRRGVRGRALRRDAPRAGAGSRPAGRRAAGRAEHARGAPLRF